MVFRFFFQQAPQVKAGTDVVRAGDDDVCPAPLVVLSCLAYRIAAAFRRPCAAEETVDACDQHHRLVQSDFGGGEQLPPYVRLGNGVGVENGDVQSRMSESAQRHVHACQVGCHL